jgi:ketosteroid isomerase-like protein
VDASGLAGWVSWGMIAQLSQSMPQPSVLKPLSGRRHALMVAVAIVPTVGCASAPPTAPVMSKPVSSSAELLEQVRAAETAFAQTMAKRDLNGFAALIAPDAVFINGGSPLRGREAILAFWGRFFKEPAAPFSWRPEIVELASNGSLGYTEGPVTSSAGKVFARFYSTWQRQNTGNWLVVFDNGYNACK